MLILVLDNTTHDGESRSKGLLPYNKVYSELALDGIYLVHDL